FTVQFSEVGVVFGLFVLRQLVHDIVDQGADATVMLGGDGQRITHPQLKKFAQHDIGVFTVNFVRHQIGVLAAAAQVFGNHAVGSHQTGLYVHHKEHDIGFLNGQIALLRHGRINALFFAGDTAGINHDKGVIAH